MAAVWSAIRVSAAVLVGVTTVGATMTGGCDDRDGSSWGRCTSMPGNATTEWRGSGTWVPFVLGVLACAAVWSLLGVGGRLWVGAQQRLDATGDIRAIRSSREPGEPTDGATRRRDTMA